MLMLNLEIGLIQDERKYVNFKLIIMAKTRTKARKRTGKGTTKGTGKGTKTTNGTSRTRPKT